MLFAMAAVAAATAFVAKAAPIVRRLVDQGDSSLVVLIGTLAGVVVLPLAFVLAVRLARMGLTGNKSVASRAERPDFERNLP